MKNFKRLAVTVILLGMSPLINTTFVSAREYLHSDHFVESNNTIVYYCTGPNAKKYHRSSNCKGLRKCSCSIVKCSKSEAEKKGFKPCKICY